MDLNLESIKRMNITGRIYHHLDCHYGGSIDPEIAHAYCSGYIDAAFNYNLITGEVKKILNDWNDIKFKALKEA